MEIIEYTEKYKDELISMFEGIQEYERGIFTHRLEGKALSEKWLGEYKPIENDEYILLAKEGEQIIGFVWAYYDTDELNDPKYRYLYISDLYLKPEYRAKGYGRKLIEECERRAKEKGNICGSFISVLALNLNAVNVYRKLGYSDNEITLYKEIKS